MKKELRKKKELLKSGIINGFLFALGMSLFDYFSNDSFSIYEFLFNFFFFGFFMALAFRFKYIKN